MNGLREPKTTDKELNIRRMALLLREGNTLLRDSCPECNSPLFKLKTGEVYCSSCDKKVFIVKDDHEIDAILQNSIYEEAIQILNYKIKKLQQEIDTEKDRDSLLKMIQLFLGYLESIKRLRNLKKIS